jgi:hypothetical protein
VAEITLRILAAVLTRAILAQKMKQPGLVVEQVLMAMAVMPVQQVFQVMVVLGTGFGELLVVAVVLSTVMAPTAAQTMLALAVMVVHTMEMLVDGLQPLALRVLWLSSIMDHRRNYGNKRL